MLSLLYGPTLRSIHDYRKTIALTTPTQSICGLLSAKWGLCFVICCLGYHSFSSKEQVSFNFMAAVIVHSDFGAQENKICHCFYFSPSVCHGVLGPYATILVVWMLSLKPVFFTSLFHPHQEALFTSSLLSAIRVVSPAYLNLLIFLLAILIPACESSSLAFCIM